jgi:hypothetical protein
MHEAFTAFVLRNLPLLDLHLIDLPVHDLDLLGPFRRVRILLLAWILSS